MGMSSSQARLLTLTARMHDIEYKAQRVEAQKLQMANESRRVYEDYLDALDKTKIQQKILTTNGSVTFVDTNLYNLMFGMSGTDGTYSAGSTPRLNSNGVFVGDDTGSSSVKVPWQYGMFSTTTGKMLVPDAVMEAYEANVGNPDGFAAQLSGWKPDPGASGGGGNSSGGGGGSYPGGGGGVTGNNHTNPTTNASYNHEPSSDAEYNISRKSSGHTSVTIGANKTDATLHVHDGVTGVDKDYTITTGSSSITAKILDTGRLQFTGNGATIKAAEGNQVDDIILKGSNNTVYTYGGNDTVRINMVKDSGGKSYKNNCTGNKVYTGDGNDYVENIGNNLIDMGNGTDSLYEFEYYASSPQGAEQILHEGNYTGGYVTGQNGDYGWGMQGSYGNCQTLALLNALDLGGDLSNYATIESDSTGWKVTFTKSGKSTHVNTSELNPNKGVSGDKDNAIIERAIINLLKKEYGVNLDSNKNASGRSDKWKYIAKCIFGESASGGAHYFSTDEFSYMLGLAKSGQISNLVVGTQSGNSSLGIVSSHAYTVDAQHSEVGKYVTLVNPHDNNDRINLEWNDFLRTFKFMCLFGDSFDKFYDHYTEYNVTATSSYATSCATSYAGIVTEPVDLTADTSEEVEYQYWLNIFDGIENAGGCETIPEDMMYSTEYLTNMLNNGFAYLKMWDNKTEEWVDTSVATNTSLQEVSDEVELRKAEAKYEADMKRIDMKDRRYDTELAALDNERNAVKQEMETVKTVAKDNVDRTFRLFS